ncbi:DNA polymerase IV [Kineobactrum sediminis]|uniref:DNA polymerase IV n=1 Tax=Kineobactrum sediminis TaxID=1905677 RepID=A0A2N5XZB7_9GAMM|nr:DNA polymerase IV [Kineobactrum sediminis]PLW81484.1 DNA polymerase IV [Kineobactrum sediminis]
MPTPPTPQRKIIHIDMDAFFASVEQRDNPELRGKPVAVGGSEQRGVVAAASYEARVFGVRSAMPSVTAKRRCPQLQFVRPRFEVYREVSRQIRQIFARHSDLIEPLSLDEAYLDVTRDKQGIGSATQVAMLIREEIRAETGLTASAGVSYNKFLAKVASDQNKPDGMFVVRPHEGADFAATLPARRFYGVGPRTAERMAALGIHTGADLREKGLAFLQTHFGKSADYLYGACRGEDDRPVRVDRLRKSIGGERTYTEDLHDDNALVTALEHIIDLVWSRIEKNNASGRTLTLKVKYADFQQITRARSVATGIATRQDFSALAHAILASLLPVPQGVRLLGLSLSSLEQTSRATHPLAVAESSPTQHKFGF